jgi:hypothetical protein
VEASALGGQSTWNLRLGDRPLRLSPGSHDSPREGVCVVELASLLAGEKFSDRPRCVCDVVAGFMRSLNDRLAHADRQRLIPYASRALGTNDGPAATRARRDLCLAWAGANTRGGAPRRFASRLGLRLKIWALVGIREALRIDEGAAVLAARTVFAREGADAAYASLDRLIDAGEELEPAPLAHPVQGAAQARVTAAVGELVRDAQVAKQENGGQRADHNGNGGDLGRRHPGEGDEEHVERDHSRNGDPEGGAEASEELHDPARVA